MKYSFFLALSFIMIVQLSGCSSTNSQQLHSLPKISSKYVITAKMEKISEGNYRFSSFSINGFGHTRLDNLMPAFNTDDVECHNALIRDSKNTGVCDGDSHPFRTGSIDTGDVFMNTLGNAVAGMLTLGEGLAAHYTNTFDEEEYLTAIKSANSKIDRKQWIADITSRLDRFHMTLAEKQNAFSELQKQIDTQLNSKIEKADSSGLYEGRPSVVTSIRGIEQRPSFVVTFTDLESLLEQLETIKIETIENANIRLDCKGIYGYKHDIKNCDQAWQLSDKATIDTITYSIYSKDTVEFHVTPAVFDDNIEVKVADGSLYLFNKTSSFLTIQNISLYVGNEILNKTSVNIELAPEANLKNGIRLSSFPEYRKLTTRYDVTAKTMQEVLSYGIALKYRIIDTNKEETLFQRFKSEIRNLPNNLSETHQ